MCFPLTLNFCASTTNTLQKQEETDKKEDAGLEIKLSKAELKAKHAESNRQIWESAYVCVSKVTCI